MAEAKMLIPRLNVLWFLLGHKMMSLSWWQHDDNDKVESIVENEKNVDDINNEEVRTLNASAEKHFASDELICRWHILDEFWYDARTHCTLRDYLMIANNEHDKNKNQTEEMVCKRYVNKIGISIRLKDYSVY